jgi:hypothetical protein
VRDPKIVIFDEATSALDRYGVCMCVCVCVCAWMIVQGNVYIHSHASARTKDWCNRPCGLCSARELSLSSVCVYRSVCKVIVCGEFESIYLVSFHSHKRNPMQHTDWLQSRTPTRS